MNTATEFTPFVSLGGGLLIGLSAVLLMAGLGRIFGATGVLAGLMLPESRDGFTWRLVLLAGMVTAPTLVFLSTGSPVDIDVPVSTGMLVGGGLLVGFGAALGSGCTSGHGVCGMARLSKRSIVATATFMVATAVTVFIVRHVLGA
ncbi:MAG: YeeE/YedE thiosulfate transporter family protein [Paracoccaceae bacterium]|nr:YeeE/YedE family protein [Loktanella sp.]